METENITQEEKFLSDLTNQQKKFPHISFAAIVTAGIFILYNIAGGFIGLAFVKGSTFQKQLLQGGGQLVIMLVPAVIVMGFSPLGRKFLLRLNGKTKIRQWIAGIAGVFLFQIFVQGWSALQEFIIPDFINQFFHAIDRTLENLYRELLGSAGSIQEMLGGFLVVALIPAIAEEVLFRGLLQRSLEEVLSPKRAVWYTALAFGLAHIHPLSLIPLIIIGIYLGVLAYSTQSLALPIAAHFINNAIAIVSIYSGAGSDASEPINMAWWAAILISMLGFGLTVVMMQIVVTDAPLAFQLNMGKYKHDDDHH